MTRNLPAPDPSGSSGSQTVDTNNGDSLIIEPPVTGLPFAQAIQGLAATHSRNLGGEIGARLIAGWSAQTAQDLNDTRQQLRSTQVKLDNTQDALNEERIKSASLTSTVNHLERSKNFSHLGIFIGTSFVALGIELSKGQPATQQTIGYITIALGSILTLVSWFLPPKPQKT
jgi:hypothetical protein